MADEKPRKARKTTTRPPRKHAGSDADAAAAPVDTRGTGPNARSSESPVLAIEQASEVSRPAADDADEIRREAYVLYLSRGGVDGDDLSDWLEAERIVRQRRGSP